MSRHRGNSENEGVQSFLQVGKAELVGLLHHCIDESIRERNVLVALQLVLPILNVELALFRNRVIKLTTIGYCEYHLGRTTFD